MQCVLRRTIGTTYVSLHILNSLSRFRTAPRNLRSGPCLLSGFARFELRLLELLQLSWVSAVCEPGIEVGGDQETGASLGVELQKTKGLDHQQDPLDFATYT